MSNKTILVPEGMLEVSSLRLVDSPDRISRTDRTLILGAALLWLAENPPEITREMVTEARKAHDGHSFPEFRHMFRVAFLAPEPEMIGGETLSQFCSRYQKIGDAVAEAYRRGKVGL